MRRLRHHQRHRISHIIQHRLQYPKDTSFVDKDVVLWFDTNRPAGQGNALTVAITRPRAAGQQLGNEFENGFEGVSQVEGERVVHCGGTGERSKGWPM